MAGTLSLFDWRPAPPDPGPGAPVERAECAEPLEPAVPITAVATALGSGSVSTPRAPARAPATAPVRTAARAPARAADGELRVVVFDCETTGTDRIRDQIIELCVQHGLDGDDLSTHRIWRIKPDVPIHPGAQAVHGISAEDLEACPAFGAVADEIADVFAAADVIVGYNLAFDIDMLQAEYTRINRPLLDFTGKKIVDAFRLWQQCEPRSLQHAHQRFVGNEFAAAHTASADVAATGRVLSGMLRAFNLADHGWEHIASISDPLAQQAARASWVGPSRHLRRDGETIVVGFGKYEGAPLHELAAGPDRSFLRWVLERDFPVHVREICRAALDLPSEQFLLWANERYGQGVRPPPVPSAS
ncbi:MAG: exonuclease domain-containing protein [Kofleriaceae bacterium]